MQYALLIYTPEPGDDVPPEVIAAEMEGYNEFTDHIRERGAMKGGEALDSTCDRDDRPRRRRQDDHDRRAVRRDEGDARRLLPRRGGRSRRGDPLRRDDPRGQARLHRGPPRLGLLGRRRRAARRGCREQLTLDGADALLGRAGRRPRRRRPPVPRGAGPGGRDAHPRDRRLRPGRGGGPGRLHQRARDVAAARRAGQPGRVDHDDGAQPGHRPVAPPEAPDREDRDAGPRGGARVGPARHRRRDVRGRHAHRRRPPSPHLHVLPPGARARRPGRPDAAHAGRPDDARDRARVPRPGSRRSPSASSAPSARSATPGSPIASHRAELLPERLDGVLRVLYLVFNEGYAASSGDSLIRRELCAEAIRLARVVVALLPDEPEARGLLALMLLHDARRDARVGTGGELILLDDQDRARWDTARIAEGQGIVAARLRRTPARSVPAPGGDRRAPRRGDDAGGDGLGADRRALRGVAADGAVTGGGIEPGRGRRDGRGSGGRPRDDGWDRRGGGTGSYPYLHAGRADLLRRLERWSEAEAAYRRALDLTSNRPERAFLEERLDQVKRRRERRERVRPN